MMKRSELAKGIYVRITNEYDDHFWSRLLKGRYMLISNPDTTPDDAKCWGLTGGGIVFHSMGFHKSVSNVDMEPVSGEEAERLRYIAKNKKSYPEFHKLGLKINRAINLIEEIIFDELQVFHFDLWDISDRKDFKRAILDELPEDDDSDIEDKVEELALMFDELDELLTKLTQLEDKIVRGIGSSEDIRNWVITKVNKDQSEEEYLKITGPMQNVLEIFSMINKNELAKTGNLAFEMKEAI